MIHPHSETYLRGIDGIRAIAVLAVIAFHAGLAEMLPGGFAGVDVFFVVSGYVISRSLSGHAGESLPAFLGGFYARRMRRILPALLVCLLATVIASVLFVPSVWISREHELSGLMAFFGLSNFVLAGAGSDYFSPGVDLNPFLHTWSLGVEEQFYLLFPAVMLFWLKGRQAGGLPGWVAWLALPVLTALSLGFAAVETPASPNNAFYLLPSRFWELAAGALLFQAHTHGYAKLRSRLVGEGVLLAGLAMTVLGFGVLSEASFPFPSALLPVIGTVLMINGVASAPGGVLGGVLASPVAAYIGRISYSLYLWHWPVLVLARWTTGFETSLVVALYVPLVFGLASLSYHFVEMPVRTGTWFVAWPRWRQLAAGLLSARVFWFAAGQAFDLKPVIGLSATKEEAVWRSISWVPLRDLGALADGLDLDGRRIFAFGDSHAAAYRTMLKEVSETLGVDIIEHEMGDCPYPGLLDTRAEKPDCAAYYDAAFADIRANARPGDFVLLAGLRVPEMNDTDQDWILKQARKRLEPECIALALQDGQAAMTALDLPGVHVIIDAPAPVLKAPPYRCSDWFNAANPVCAPGLTVARSLMDELRAPVLASMAALAAAHPDLTIWDPFPVLCPGETCSAYDEKGLPLYFDSDHLSGNGNRVLTPSFISLLKTLVEKEAASDA